MKYECDIIEDLLPLYKDKACSAASSKAVEPFSLKSLLHRLLQIQELLLTLFEESPSLC